MSLQRSISAATLLAALLAGGCSLVGGDPAADEVALAAASGPSPAVMAEYSTVLAQLQAGDEGSDSALQAFSAAHPELAGPLLNLALLRMRQGDEAGAREYFGKAAAVCTSCAPVWNGLGVLNRQQGQFSEAEQAYLKAIELDPGYALAYYNLAVLYDIYVQRPELALLNYQQYISLGADEGNAEVERWIADLRRRVSATPTTASAEGAT
ncbi:MAG: tetratricopeptide repeat protein [Chromatiales bacterium]|nr:tetratricopeptide repeat protein [Chromatiales bacterium]